VESDKQLDELTEMKEDGFFCSKPISQKATLTTESDDSKITTLTIGSSSFKIGTFFYSLLMHH